MFGDYLVLDHASDRNAKKIFKLFNRDLLNKSKVIVTIGGISGTRKSETAYWLASHLINFGKQSHIISGDDYYIVPWNIRNDTRQSNGLDSVGADEWDWLQLQWTLDTFKTDRFKTFQFFQSSKFSKETIWCSMAKSGIDVLILEGLYACDPRIKADLKVHIGSTNPDSTYKFRNKRGKENEQSELRHQVVTRECKAVEAIKEHANHFITQVTMTATEAKTIFNLLEHYERNVDDDQYHIISETRRMKKVLEAEIFERTFKENQETS